MKEKVNEHYLGDYIHNDENTASAAATVGDRYGRALVGGMEIECCRSQQVGGLKAGMHLWETTHIPSLLNNCQTWVEISEETIEKLEELQNKFFRSILSVPRTTPKAALIWEMGGMKMKWRIIEKKLLFMNHILHVDQNSLAKQIQIIQEREDLPGLTKEVKEFIERLKLPNLFEHSIQQNEWKALVKASVKDANEAEVKEILVGYKKLKGKPITREQYGMKPYMENLSVFEARTIFKHKTSMTRYVKLNYKGVKKYKAVGWKCEECQNLDSEEHLLWCKGYEEIGEYLDI